MGNATGALLFMLLYTLGNHLPVDAPLRFNRVLYSSHHLFVEICAKEATIRESPDLQSETLLQLPRNTLLLLSNVRKVGDIVWNRVLIDEGEFGWVERVTPAQVGVAEQRISRAENFSLRYGDIYLLLLMIPAVVWGYRSFHVRPQ